MFKSIENKNKKMKILISERFLNQVNYMHTKVSNATEWCAITHYEIVSKNHDDLLEADDIVIRMLNLYPMNIGSAAYTSTRQVAEEQTKFNSFFAPDYYADLFNPPVIYTGFIHSHHNMSTFFSGTDTKELEDNYKNYPNMYYVSLIVDYDMKYSARAVFGTKEESEIRIPAYTVPAYIKKYREYRYGRDLGTKEELIAAKTYDEVSKTETLDIMNWFICDIEFESDWKSLFDERFTAISRPAYSYNNYHGYRGGGYPVTGNASNKAVQTEMNFGADSHLKVLCPTHLTPMLDKKDGTFYCQTCNKHYRRKSDDKKEYEKNEREAKKQKPVKINAEEILIEHLFIGVSIADKNKGLTHLIWKKDDNIVTADMFESFVKSWCFEEHYDKDTYVDLLIKMWQLLDEEEFGNNFKEYKEVLLDILETEYSIICE